MTANVPTIGEQSRVSDMAKLLIEKTKTFDSINYIYVLNQSGKLKGVVSVKEVFRSPKKTPVKDVMSRDIVSISARTHHARAAYIALKHNIKAVPVVDKEGKFLGAIPSDVILDGLYRKTTKDILRFGGVLHTSAVDDIFRLSLFTSLKHRLPWLILGLAGGVLASGIVRGFEAVISKNLILAAFIPLIVYMADAVGTQMEAFMIRDLALTPRLKFIKYFTHQFLIVTMMGSVIGALAYAGTLMIYGQARISFVVALALFFAILSALFSGLIIPFLFSKLKTDPANASGPIATILQDIISVFVYFAIAYLLL